jgi:hypothetical protein
MSWDNNPGGRQEGLPDYLKMSKDNLYTRKEGL